MIMADEPLNWALFGAGDGAGDGNRTRTISLGMSAGMEPTSAAAGGQIDALSVSTCEVPQ